MQIILDSASYYKGRNRANVSTLELSMEKVVEQFINDDIRFALNAMKGDSVNVEVPTKAYDNLTLFGKKCDQVLTGLGYKCSISHDGAGQYNTLLVSIPK